MCLESDFLFVPDRQTSQWPNALIFWWSRYLVELAVCHWTKRQDLVDVDTKDDHCQYMASLGWVSEELILSHKRHCQLSNDHLSFSSPSIVRSTWWYATPQHRVVIIDYMYVSCGPVELRFSQSTDWYESVCVKKWQNEPPYLHD